MPSTERLFMFNPFNIKNWTSEQVKEQFDILIDSLSGEDTPFGLAYDIELYANLGYLCGEMIARFHEEFGSFKVEVESNINNATYRERKSWAELNTEKPPAMSYFESKAQTQYIGELKKLMKMESDLKRFKYAYDSIESKQNALKKKLESIKFDTFGR